MSRILVIGGYGGFGARLSRRLAAAGHRLLIAGRDRSKALSLAGQLAAAEAVVIDRNDDVDEPLQRLRPDLVVDGAGPFQESSYRIPEACIRAGIPYLDLADARDFVCGIDTLDSAASEAGVAIVSGASSAPGLTSAVALELAAGLERVHAVEIALSAANRASGGESVVAAVLSYAGRSVRLWRGGRWTCGVGWHAMRREDFLPADGSGLERRLVALADLPDCELLPALLPGRPALLFRAGTESSLQMRALWLVSWAVRWRWLTSLTKFQSLLMPLYRWTARGGGKRSAMKIVLTGSRGGEAVERRWTIVAERGEGLEIPTLTAQLLAEDLLAGLVPPGARSAAGLLSFERYRPALAGLAVRHEFAERTLPPPLYARLLGTGFDRLPPPLRDLHNISVDGSAAGEGTVLRGRHPVARVLARMMRMPPAGTYPLHVAFDERGGVERWTRDFGGHVFASELSASGSLLVERFGPLRFAFALPCSREGLEMRLQGWSFFRIPLPIGLAPRIFAREWEAHGRFRFDVEVCLPWGTRVVHYSGWLTPAVAQEKGRRRTAPPVEGRSEAAA